MSITRQKFQQQNVQETGPNAPEGQRRQTGGARSLRRKHARVAHCRRWRVLLISTRTPQMLQITITNINHIDDYVNNWTKHSPTSTRAGSSSTALGTTN